MREAVKFLLRKSFKAKDGSLWLGTHAGFAKLENGKFTAVPKGSGIPDNYVKTVHVDHSGAVWIGTNTGGVSCFKNGNFTHYTKQDGLLSNSIWSIYEDSAGTIWLGTIDGGLSRYRDGRFDT